MRKFLEVFKLHIKVSNQTNHVIFHRQCNFISNLVAFERTITHKESQDHAFLY